MRMLRSEILRLSVVLVCGVLSGLALIIPPLWPVVFVALAPLIIVVEVSLSGKQAMCYGVLWGAGLIGVSISFGFAALPLDWLGVSVPAIGFLAVSGAWIMLTLVFAVPVGFFSFTLWHLRDLRPWLLILFVPVFWVSFEITRITLYSLIELGPGTAIGSYLTFGYLGYTLAWAEGLLVLAPFGGPLFLSGFIAFINVGVYLTLKHYASRPLALFSIFLIVPGAFLSLNAILPPYVQVEIGVSRTKVADAHILLVHTDEAASFALPQNIQTAKHQRLSLKIMEFLTASSTVDVVVLPEDRRFIQSITNSSTPEERIALEMLAEHKVLLMDTARVEDGKHARNILYAYDFEAQRLLQVSAKSLLVPYGEYVPYSVSLVASVLGFQAEVEKLIDVRASYIPVKFNANERIIEWRGVSYGLLSCSEILYPYYAKALADAGADAIVSMSSQSWTEQDSLVLFNQMLAMAIVNTAWTGKPYLQSTNKAPNVVIRLAGG